MNSKPMTTARRVMCAAAIAAATLSACADDSCFVAPVPGIILTVTDSVTGLAPASAPLVRVSDGAIEDTLTPNLSPPPSVPYLLMFSSKAAVGVFRITVSADGYQTFVREGVRVEPLGRCGLNSQETIAARLQPTGLP